MSVKTWRIAFFVFSSCNSPMGETGAKSARTNERSFRVQRQDWHLAALPRAVLLSPCCRQQAPAPVLLSATLHGRACAAPLSPRLPAPASYEARHADSRMRARPRARRSFPTSQETTTQPLEQSQGQLLLPRPRCLQARPRETHLWLYESVVVWMRK